MNILVAVEEFRIGGAQTFALRLAQALHEAGNKVYLYNMYWQYTEHDLVKRLAPDVELLQYQPANEKLDLLISRADDWFQRKGWAVSLRKRVLLKHLREVIRTRKIDVVSSNTFKCDHLQAQALQAFPRVPLVVTMHGDYEQFLVFYRQQQQYAIPNYPQKLAETIARINGIAYLSEQNLEVIQPAAGIGPATHIQVRRIYNGMEGRFSSEAASYTRAALGIGPDELVFGMVARGVPEKGWEPVISAFQQLRATVPRPMKLVLVGASAFLDQLRATHAADEDLRFLGFVNNPVDCAAAFDVGILASSLKESLPNSIAEYLFCGKAVISTNVGEIEQMIRTDDGQEAGLLTDFPAQGLADVQQLYQAMKRYATEPDLLLRHQALAPQAFAKFDMSRCVASYMSLYQDCAKAIVPHE
ncbi:glycosyltransferase family 4 protein [Hymenobacter segetis]